MDVPTTLVPIPEAEGGKEKLKQWTIESRDAINRIISYLEERAKPEDILDVTAPTVRVSSAPFSFEGFTSSTASGFLNAPSGGYTDETGNHLVGIIKMDRVPLNVREAYRAWQEGQVQG